MTVERCMGVVVKSWRSKFFNSKKAVIVSCLISLIFFFLNFQQMITGRYMSSNSNSNGTLDNTISSYVFTQMIFVYNQVTNEVLALTKNSF